MTGNDSDWLGPGSCGYLKPEMAGLPQGSVCVEDRRGSGGPPSCRSDVCVYARWACRAGQGSGWAARTVTVRVT